MPGFERTKQTQQWQAGPVTNTDDLLKSVNDTDQNIHLDNRQVGQRRRWQRVHKIQDKIAQKQLSKEMPMPETEKTTKAREWLQKLDKKEKGDSIDELWGKAALGAGALGTYYSGMTGPLLRGAGKLAYHVVPGVKQAHAAGQYIAGVPGRIGSTIGSGYETTAGAVGSGAATLKSAAASTVPAAASPTAFGTKVILPGLVGYSVGALVGLLTRAAMHSKYRVNKDKLKQIMNIPSTTRPEDIAGTLDWFGFTQQGAMIRNGQGDPIIALQNILRALNGDRKYTNPATGGKMMVREKVPMFNMGKKAAAISDLHATLKAAHEHIKEFDFTYMIQERFKWETPEDYYTTHEPMDEEALTIALVALSAVLGAIQFGKFDSMLNQIESKVQRLMSANTEQEALRLVGQIVDAFGLNVGKLVVNKKADPLLAIQMVLDYLEGNRRTRNPVNGYKMATPVKAMSTIPFGAANASAELLGYVEEVQDLIKRLQAQR